MSRVEAPYLLLEPLVLLTLPPSRSKLPRGSGDFTPRTRPALRGRSEGGEEVRGGLLIGALEAHIDKELLGGGCGAKVDLLALVEDGYLVEDVVGGLRSLVDCYGGCGTEKVRREAKVPTELNGVGRVQTASRVVPALERSIRESDLGDCDSLPSGSSAHDGVYDSLSSRDSSDKVVPDLGVDSVGDTKDGHHRIAHESSIFCPRDTIGRFTWSSGLGRESGKSASVYFRLTVESARR